MTMTCRSGRANEDKQNVKHPKHKDLETVKHVAEADNKLNDLVLLDMKLLTHPSHINRRPPSLHFALADFLDLSEGEVGAGATCSFCPCPF